MRNPRIRDVAVALLSLISVINEANAAIELSPLLPIKGIYTNPAGGALLILDASNAACGSSGNQFNVTVGQVGVTADGAKTAMAAALMAFAMDKQIRVYFDPTIPGCPVQQVILLP